MLLDIKSGILLIQFWCRGTGSGPHIVSEDSAVSQTSPVPELNQICVSLETSLQSKDCCVSLQTAGGRRGVLGF